MLLHPEPLTHSRIQVAASNAVWGCTCATADLGKERNDLGSYEVHLLAMLVLWQLLAPLPGVAGEEALLRRLQPCLQ